jgi:hypothetical protein
MRPHWKALSAIVLVAVVLLAGSATAGRKEGDEVLVMGEHIAISIDLEKGEVIEIRIFLVVTDGPQIDVFIMTEKAYEDYITEADFDHFVDYSVIATKNVDKTFEWDGEGTYFVVFDNTISETPPPMDPEFANATLRYVVTWGPPDEGVAFREWIVYIILAAAAVFVAILAVKWIRTPR